VILPFEMICQNQSIQIHLSIFFILLESIDISDTIAFRKDAPALQQSEKFHSYDLMSKGRPAIYSGCKFKHKPLGFGQNGL